MLNTKEPKSRIFNLSHHIFLVTKKINMKNHKNKQNQKANVKERNTRKEKTLGGGDLRNSSAIFGCLHSTIQKNGVLSVFPLPMHSLHFPLFQLLKTTRYTNQTSFWRFFKGKKHIGNIVACPFQDYALA